MADNKNPGSDMDYSEFLKDSERVKPLSLDQAKKMSPGLMRLMPAILNKLKAQGVIPEDFVLPAIYFCSKEEYRKYLEASTQKSNSPHNESRGFMAVEAASNTIYIDIDTVNSKLELKRNGKPNLDNEKSVISAITEEIIHSFTISTHRIGFVKFPENARLKSFPPGIYLWNRVSEDDSEVYQFEENEAEICALENLTKLAVVLSLDYDTLTCVIESEDKDSEEYDIKFARPMEHVKGAFRMVTGRNMAEVIVECMNTGDLNSIKRMLVDPLRVAAKNDVEVNRRLLQVEMNIKDPLEKQQYLYSLKRGSFSNLADFLEKDILGKRAKVVPLNMNEG